MGVIKQVIIIDLKKIYFIIDVSKIQNCHWSKKNSAHSVLPIPSCSHIKLNNITLGKKIDNIKFTYTTYPV